MEVLTRDSAALEEELRAISGSDDTFLETRTRLADELSDLKLKALAAQKDIESHRAAIAQLESRTDESDARARQLAANIETLTAQNAERAAQIETIRAAIAGSRNEIEKREEAKAGAVRRRMEKEGGITQQTARVRKITDEREALGLSLIHIFVRRAEIFIQKRGGLLFGRHHNAVLARIELARPVDREPADGNIRAVHAAHLNGNAHQLQRGKDVYKRQVSTSTPGSAARTRSA